MVQHIAEILFIGKLKLYVINILLVCFFWKENDTLWDSFAFRGDDKHNDEVIAECSCNSYYRKVCNLLRFNVSNLFSSEQNFTRDMKL